jgi:hypothetical protein
MNNARIESNRALSATKLGLESENPIRSESSHKEKISPMPFAVYLQDRELKRSRFSLYPLF